MLPEIFFFTAKNSFGDEFRPVRLDLHVLAVPWKRSDDPQSVFQFDNHLNYRLLEVIILYNPDLKPTLIFVNTRSGTFQAGESVGPINTCLDAQFFNKAKILLATAAASHKSLFRDVQHRNLLSEFATQLQDSTLKGYYILSYLLVIFFNTYYLFNILQHLYESYVPFINVQSLYQKASAATMLGSALKIATQLKLHFYQGICPYCWRRRRWLWEYFFFFAIFL